MKQEKGGTKVTCPGVVESAGKADGRFTCQALDEIFPPSANETDCYILFIFQMEGKAKKKKRGSFTTTLDKFLKVLSYFTLFYLLDEEYKMTREMLI